MKNLKKLWFWSHVLLELYIINLKPGFLCIQWTSKFRTKNDFIARNYRVNTFCQPPAQCIAHWYANENLQKCEILIARSTKFSCILLIRSQIIYLFNARQNLEWKRILVARNCELYTFCQPPAQYIVHCKSNEKPSKIWGSNCMFY